MDPLTQILAPARRTTIVDVGANPIDGDPPYKRMLAAGLCEVTGFEPQGPALARLKEKAGPLERYLPHALGDGTSRTLHVCGLDGMTSLKVPDPAHLALFNLFPIWGDVTARIPVDTHRLDDIAEIAHLDFLKMDIQGSERDVLEHGRDKLAEAVAIQTEVSFVTLYEGQPTLGEMDTLLRGMGFLPHCFAEMKVWPLAPLVVGGQPNRGLRQLLEADMVYVRDFTRATNMTPEQWKHLALIAHHCYGSADLALRCLNMLAELGALPADAGQRYLDSLPGKPN
ncbi:MAG: FkbM family methyltransferase [Acetobacteraceae bacterium]|nr:MAG: FkbM family methyltransferase [Acetobacteraceae bacterium]